MDTQKDFPLDLKILSGLIGGIIAVLLTILISSFLLMKFGVITPTSGVFEFIFECGLIPSLIPSAISGAVLGIVLARRRYSTSHSKITAMLRAGLGGLIISVAGVVLMAGTLFLFFVMLWWASWG